MRHCWIWLSLCLLILAGCKPKIRTRIEQGKHTYSSDTLIQGFQFCRVDRGDFKSGYKNEQATIPYTYYIMKYEVTCSQYFSFLKSRFADKKAWIKGDRILMAIKGYKEVKDTVCFIKVLDAAIYLSGDTLMLNPAFANHPVTFVNWFGCMEFCRYYGLTLPTRNEWEKAARGNTGNIFPWGNYIDSCYANYFKSNDPYEPGTTPVGYYNGEKQGAFQTQNGVSPYGCYDMAGNAWEYSSDYFCNITGGGGGFSYHTAGMVASPFQNCFGLPQPIETGVCDTSDGFRAVFKMIEP